MIFFVELLCLSRIPLFKYCCRLMPTYYDIVETKKLSSVTKALLQRVCTKSVACSYPSHFIDHHLFLFFLPIIFSCSLFQLYCQTSNTRDRAIFWKVFWKVSTFFIYAVLDFSSIEDARKLSNQPTKPTKNMGCIFSQPQPNRPNRPSRSKRAKSSSAREVKGTYREDECAKAAGMESVSHASRAARGGG